MQAIPPPPSSSHPIEINNYQSQIVPSSSSSTAVQPEIIVQPPTNSTNNYVNNTSSSIPIKPTPNQSSSAPYVNEEVEYDEYRSSTTVDDESTLLRCCGLRPEGENLSLHPSIAICSCGKRNGNTLMLYRLSEEARTWPKVWIVGPDWPCLCITFSLILAPSIAFFIFVASTMHTAVLLVSLLTLIILLAALSMTAGSDPGYLKKQTPRLLEQMKQNLVAQAVQQYGPEQGNQVLNNYSTCIYCQQLRAPGTSHCYDCDACVEELDHHCPWTGKCIGKYYRSNMCSILTVLQSSPITINNNNYYSIIFFFLMKYR